MRKILFSFLISFFVLLSFLKNCQAESQVNDNGFSIAPFFQEVALEKDQPYAKFNLEVSNNTAMPVVFKLAVLDFGSLDESGGVAFLGASEKNLTNRYGLASWVVLEKDALALNPKEKQSIQVTIQNKESLSPGGHYAAIVLKIENDESDVENKSSEVAFNPSFASLIFARKLGGEIYDLRLNNKEVGNNIFSLPSSIDLRFRNSGNVHTVPRGAVSLIDPLGKEVMKGVINQESGLILPETFRIFSIDLKKVALAYFPGRYKLFVRYRFDGKEDFVTEEQTINFVPLPVILFSLIIALLLIIYGWFRIIKKRKRK